MPRTWLQRAERAAELTTQGIAAAGNTITLPSGATVKAITDEQPEAIAKELAAQEIDTLPQGRRCLFYFAAGTLPPDTRYITYDGLRWALQPPRSEKAVDVLIQVVAIGHVAPV